MSLKKKKFNMYVSYVCLYTRYVAPTYIEYINSVTFHSLEIPENYRY